MSHEWGYIEYLTTVRVRDALRDSLKSECNESDQQVDTADQEYEEPPVIAVTDLDHVYIWETNGLEIICDDSNYYDWDDSAPMYLSGPGPAQANLLETAHLFRKAEFSITQILTNKVYSKLPEPKVCTLDDIVEAARDAILIDPTCSEHGFCRSIAASAFPFEQVARTRTVSVGVEQSRVFARFYSALPESQPIIHLGNSVWINMEKAESQQTHIVIPHFFIDGQFTQRASKHLAASELVPFCAFARAILLSSERCSSLDFNQNHRRPDPLQNPNSNTLKEMLIYEQSKRDHDESAATAALQMVLSRFREYRCTPKRTVFQAKRILVASNAMAQAAANSGGVKLSLYCTALEALLGEGSETISDRLARNVSTLLCSDPNDRSAMYDVVKKLYATRSHVIHGVTPTNEKEFSTQAFAAEMILQHVLLAICRWEEAARRFGVETGKADRAFFDQLKDAQHSGKPVVGLDSVGGPVVRMLIAPIPES